MPGKLDAVRNATVIAPSLDSSIASSFLNGLFGDADPGLWVLIWCLQPGTGDRAKKSWWFQVSDLAIAAERAMERSAKKEDVYVQVALSPNNFGPKERCKADATAGMVALWADVDYGAEGHKKTNHPPDAVQALDLVRSMPIQPTLIVNSGHGLHPWWCFKEPWIFTDAADRRRGMELAERWELLLRRKATEKGWGLDSTHDLARVLRVPGTMNQKGMPMPVTIFSADWSLRYTRDDFEPFAVPMQAAPAGAQRCGSITVDPKARPDPMSLANLLDDPKFKGSYFRKRNLASASEYDMSLATQAAMAGWSDQEICDLLVSTRVNYGDDLKRPDYYQTTISNARASAERCIGQIEKKEEAKARQFEQDKREEQEELIAIEASQKIAAAATPEEKLTSQQEALGKLQKLLALDFVGFIRYLADPEPSYKMVLTCGELWLGGIATITNQRTFLNKVATLAKKSMPMRKRGWVAIVQAILDCCEDQELGEDAKDSGAGRAWIEGYIEDANTTAMTMEEAIKDRQPFERNGETYFFENRLADWVKGQRNLTLSAKELGKILRAGGSRPTPLPVTINGKPTTRSVWIVPKTK
jgi:hypothetical protein